MELEKIPNEELADMFSEIADTLLFKTLEDNFDKILTLAKDVPGLDLALSRALNQLSFSMEIQANTRLEGPINQVVVHQEAIKRALEEYNEPILWNTTTARGVRTLRQGMLRTNHGFYGWGLLVERIGPDEYQVYITPKDPGVDMQANTGVDYQVPASTSPEAHSND